MLQRTIILTSSIRVTAATQEDLNRLENALLEAARVFDDAKIIEGCHPDTTVDDVTTDTEVVNDNEGN